MSGATAAAPVRRWDRLHPQAAVEHRDDVRRLLGEDLFRRRDGLSNDDGIALTYERLAPARPVGRARPCRRGVRREGPAVELPTNGTSP